MIKNVVLLVAALTLVGCAGTQNIAMQPDSFAANKPKTITTATREKPSFSAMTASKGAFALVGAIASISAGNDLIEQNQVEDPAVYIGDALASILEKHFALQRVDNNSAVLEDATPAAIAARYPMSDLVVDVQTLNWSFIYFPTDWDNYRVIYTAKLRLVDTRANEMVAEGFCKRIPEQDENSPSYDELVANDAQRLKDELKLAAEHCIREFQTKVLKI
ncbi:hypothetical protein [Motiliproteus sp. SC1-56]|uniref:hypothetical protein n=1 Tax=Motiliproteus sp. SC1-56 TaxID=2799565 RepID=UPI001A901700|nr:hypothetical protein [Motiliproteus sp. SC1-56]